MESYLPSRAFSLWLCEFWIPLWILAWLQQEGTKQPQPKLCLKPPGSGTSQWVGSAGGKMPSPGRSAQPPRWALNHWDTVQRWQYCLLWTWLWVAEFVGCCFAVGVSVWAEGTCSAGLTCVVSRSAPSMAIPDDHVALEWASSVCWAGLKKRFFFSISLLLGNYSCFIPWHDNRAAGADGKVGGIHGQKQRRRWHCHLEWHLHEVHQCVQETSPSLSVHHSGARGRADLTLFSKTICWTLFPVSLWHLDFRCLHLTWASVQSRSI